MAFQVQRDVVNGVSLAHARAGVDQSTRDPHADTALHQVDKLFNGGCGDPIVPAHQGMVLQCQRGRLRHGPDRRGFFGR